MILKNKFFFLVLFFLFFCFHNLFSKDYIDGEVIVKFKDSSIYKMSNGNNNNEDVDKFFKDKKNIISYKKAVPEIKNFKSNRLKSFKKSSSQNQLKNIYSVKISTDIDAKNVANELMKDSMVEWAEPRMKYKKSVIPNDTYFQDQWYINSNSNKHINVINAWDITTGSEEIVIAVLDDGLKLDHEDIKGNIWNNKSEIPNNGIDDDDNGFEDDMNGWNFYDNNNNVSPYIVPNDIDKSDLHGTHVAGIISAMGNNSKGVSGIAWKSKIMPLKVFYGDDCIGLEEAIIYATRNGADIINMSLGSETFSNYLKSVIQNASDSGVICVSAAGNDNKNFIDYPARFSNCLAVAATDQNDKKCDFSNYGYDIDISAPGDYILSLSAMSNNDYIYMAGTSMATPIISGTCALILSVNPSLNFEKIKNILQKSSDNIDVLNLFYRNKLGSGRVNVNEAIRSALMPQLNSFYVKKKDNNEIYVYWNFSKPNTLDLSYKLKISSKNDLNSLENPIITQNSSITIPLELEKEVTYYCYLQAESTKYNIKTDIFKSDPIYISDDKKDIDTDINYTEDNTISYNNELEMFIPKNTFNTNVYINILNLSNNLTDTIVIANRKTNEKLKKGQNIFSKYYDLKAFNATDGAKIDSFYYPIEITLKNIFLEENVTLKPYYLNEANLSWKKIENFTFDVQKGIFRFYTTHFSVFGIFAEVNSNDLQDIIFYPNPFKTKYHGKCVFSICKLNSEILKLSIDIFDISGKLLKHFDKKDLIKNNSNGNYEIVWDGISEKGRILASGVYFAKIKLNEEKKTIKIAILS